MIAKPQSAFDQIGALVESIYAASLDDTLWHDTLGKMSKALGGTGAILVHGRNLNGQLRLTRIREHVPPIEGRWDHYAAYHHLDIRTAHALRSQPHTVYTDYDIIDERAIDRHPFYQEFMAAHGLRYTVGARFADDAGEAGIVNVFRSKRQGHPERCEVELLGALLLHLRYACEIGRRLDTVRHAERRLREALDHIPDAIFLLEPDGRIVDANQAAERLLRGPNGLSVSHSGLKAAHHATRKPLAQAIAAAAECHLVHPPSARALPIPRPSGGRPLHALITPLSRTGAQSLPLPAASPMVMLVISDPDHPPTPLPDRLAALWDLTPAESRLAAALAGGDSARDYADANGITENTVRWTLKRLLAKADCRRQPELIRLLTAAASLW